MSCLQCTVSMIEERIDRDFSQYFDNEQHASSDHRGESTTLETTTYKNESRVESFSHHRSKSIMLRLHRRK